MTERPILFSGPMVRALLSGAKTQTRRLVKPRPGQAPMVDARWTTDQILVNIACPYGAPGDRLWVRETWAPHDQQTVRLRERASVYYRADDERRYDTDGRWRPSIHMPRWASRLTLEVTGVRVERLNDISEADAKTEGIERVAPGEWLNYDPTFRRASFPDSVMSFRSLWEHINGAGSWAANPWVWVVEFRRVTP